MVSDMIKRGYRITISSMTRNQSKSNFIEQIRSDLSNTIDTILNHPYLYALEKKEISKVKLEIFVCEQYHIITNDKRNFAFTISKASSDVARKLFTDCLEVELDALGNLTIMAEELIIDKRKIEDYELLAGCQAYTNYLTRLAVYGSDAEILTALLIDLPVWGASCSKISSILKKNYGFSEKSCIFLDKFACPLPEKFVDKSKELIETAILEREKDLHTTARLILDYELCFWDTIYKHSIIN
jgi:thiaminase